MAISTIAAIGLGAAGIGSFLGGRSKSKAADRAADLQENARAENNALAREFLTPYSDRGNAAGGAFNALLGLGGDQAQAMAGFDQYRDMAGWDFNLDRGLDAITGNAAARGLLRSGPTGKAFVEYGNNLKSSYLNNYLGMLGGQQALGANAAGNIVGAVSGNNQNAADAMGNAALVKGNNNPFANALSMFGGVASGIGG